MTTVGEIVEAGYPGVSEDITQYILWGRTCYPFGKIEPKDLFKVSSRLYRADKKHVRLCDFCDRKAVKDFWLCEKHNLDWANRKEEQ